ncbi:MAG: hypothetical protein HS130_06840 [Deltaproteobacteria bacterium]|nr:hypothetical protein [Deltaproteobacteria bacterium]MCL4872699.1 hypothetical protein [bacterium]
MHIREQFKKIPENMAATAHLLVCVASLGVIASYISVQTVEPEWSAPGWPSFNGYPKNVEHAAVAASVLASGVAAIFFEAFRSRLVKLASVLLLAPVAFLIARRHVEFENLDGLAFQLTNVLILLSFLYYFFRSAISSPAPKKASPVIMLAAAAAGMSLIFMFSLPYWFEHPLDVHHFGEQYTTAADLLSGGKPFVTSQWPHGLEDTGIAALFFFIFSRMDVPTMLLAKAFSMSLGVLALALICHGMRLGYYSVLLMAVIIVLNLVLTLSLRPALVQLSSFLFAAIALVAFSRARLGSHFFAAGALTFIAHVYRIEFGVYVLAAIAALFIFQAVGSLIYERAALRRVAKEFSLYIAGLLAAAITMYLLLGWPGREWYATTLYVLPRHHSDTGGLPFPLFLKSIAYPQGPAGAWAWAGVAFLLTTLTFAAILAGYLLKNLRHPFQIERFPVLLSFFSILLLKTAFGRSDYAHIFDAFVLTNIFIAAFCMRVVAVSRLKLYFKVLAVIALFAFFDFRTAGFRANHSLSKGRIISSSTGLLAGFHAPTPWQCSNSIFSRYNLRWNDYRDFDAAVCGLKEELRRFNINKGELLVTNSAPLIYPALGYPLPTKYYKIGLAVTGEMQREMVSELERNGVKAILRSNTGLSWYDIPDRDRLPLYYEWASERFDMENPVRTGLGDLYLLKGPQ